MPCNSSLAKNGLPTLAFTSEAPQRWKSSHRLHTTPPQNGRGCHFPFSIFNIHKRDGERSAAELPRPKVMLGWVRERNRGHEGGNQGHKGRKFKHFGREHVNSWAVRHMAQMIFQPVLGPFPSPHIGQMTPLPCDYLACRVFLGPLSIVVRSCQHPVLDRSSL